MAKRAKCEHGESIVTIQGCGVCVAEALVGIRIVRACRREFDMTPEDIVNTIRSAKGLPPLRTEDEEPTDAN